VEREGETTGILLILLLDAGGPRVLVARDFARDFASSGCLGEVLEPVIERSGGLVLLRLLTSGIFSLTGSVMRLDEDLFVGWWLDWSRADYSIVGVKVEPKLGMGSVVFRVFVLGVLSGEHGSLW
jgi:hypothetical protein